MAIKSSGSLPFADIRNEFGGQEHMNDKITDLTQATLT